MPFPEYAETIHMVPFPRWDTDPDLEGLRTWGPWITRAVLALEAKVGADQSTVETSHDYMLSSSRVLASLEIDHALTSPAVILPGATHDRKVLILVTGTEAAAGDPHINIGQRGNQTKFFSDVGAGAWGLGFAGAVVGTISAPFDMRATIPAAGSAGKLQVTVIELPSYTKLVVG